MCITEYNEEKVRNQTLEEGKAIGKAEGEAIGIQKGEAIGIQKGEAIGIQKGEAIGIQKGEAIGIQKGILEILVSLVKDGILTLAEAAGRYNVTVSEFEALTGLKA